MRIQITRKNATVIFAAIHVLYFCTLALIGGYFSPYLLALGLNSAQLGIAHGVCNLCAAGFQLLSAAFVRRTGTRICTVVRWAYMPITVLAVVLLAVPVNAVLFCILFLIIGLMTFGLQSTVNGLYLGYHEQGTRINFGLARGCGSVAYSVSSLVAGIVIQRQSALILPALYLVPCILLSILLYIFNAPNVTEVRSEDVSLSDERLTLRKYPQFFLFFLGVICLTATHGFMETYLLLIVENVGGTSTNLGVALFISSMTELPAMAVYRRIADRVGNRRLLAFAATMWAAKNFCIILAPNVYFIYAAELLQFVGYAFYVPSYVRYIAHTLPESEFLKGQALVGSAFTGGYLLAGFVGGPLINGLGIHAAMWCIQLFSLAGILFIACAMKKSLAMFPHVPIGEKAEK